MGTEHLCLAKPKPDLFANNVKMNYRRDKGQVSPYCAGLHWNQKRNVLEDVLCLLQGTIGLYLGFVSLKNKVTPLYNCHFWGLWGSYKSVEPGQEKLADDTSWFIEGLFLIIDMALLYLTVFTHPVKEVYINNWILILNAGNLVGGMILCFRPHNEHMSGLNGVPKLSQQNLLNAK